MNNQKLNKTLLLAIFTTLLILPIATSQIFDLNYESGSLKAKKNLSPSAIWFLTNPIVIDDTDPSKNWSKTALENAWCNGTGTSIDPYTIADVEIDIQGGSVEAISISNSEVYFKIQNCVLLNTSNGGIYLNNVTNGILFDNTIFGTGYGIYLIDSENVIITDNIIYSVIGSGMFIFNSNNNSVNSNTITDYGAFYDGIHIESSNYNSFSFNIISSNNTRQFGLSMESSNYNEIIQNTIYDLDSYYADGIYLAGANNNTIAENNVTGWRIGIVLSEGDYNNFTKNLSYDNDLHGLSVASSYGSSIIENILVNNTDGLSINNGNYDYFFNNEINFNDRYGIRVFRSSNTTLENNTLRGNQNVGIFLLQSIGINLFSNLMFDNGLYLEDSDWPDDELNSHVIDSTNQVNNRNLYYYTNKSGLKESDFTNAGQVILYNCTDSIIKNLNLSSATLGLLTWYGENNTLSGNELSYNSRNGMEIINAERFNISNNIANYYTSSDGETNTGLWLSGMNHSIITGNTANYNGLGIFFSGDNSEISSNSVNYNENEGMLIIGTNHTISNNIANNNEIGIILSTSNSSFTDNEASYNNIYGLELDDAHYNIITGNDFIGNLECIHQLPNSQGNIIQNNNCLGQYDSFWAKNAIWITIGIVSAISFSALIIILRKLVIRRKKYSE